MKYIINTDALYGGDIYKSMLLMGTNGRGEVIVQKFNLDELEELNGDYINEHYGSLQDDAYQRGLDDAWEAARKIIHMSEANLLNIFTECYSSVCTALQVLLKYDASEAIEKLKAYEEKQNADDKIEVGDEVADKDGDKTIVTNIHGDLFDGLCSDGSTMTDLFLDDNHKTGRHFDIAKILEEMRNE